MNVVAQVIYNDSTGQVEIRIQLPDAQGDHVLAALPAIPPPADE